MSYKKMKDELLFLTRKFTSKLLYLSLREIPNIFTFLDDKYHQGNLRTTKTFKSNFYSLTKSSLLIYKFISDGEILPL